MAFLSAFMAGLAGQSEGRHKAYIDALAQDDSNKKFLEEQRRWDLQQAQLQQQQQRDAWRFSNEQSNAAETVRLRGLKPPDDISHPKNHGTAFTNEQQARNLLRQAEWYASQGDTVRASDLRSQASTYATLGANENRYELGSDRLLLDRDKLQALKDHRTATLNQRSSQFNDRERRLASQYASSYSQRSEIANLNHADRIYVSQLAGTIRVHTNDDNAAIRQALAQYTQESQNFRAFNAPKNQLLTGGDPTMPQGVPSAAPAFPPVNVNVYGAGGAAPPAWSPPPAPNPNGIPTTPGGAPPARIPRSAGGANANTGGTLSAPAQHEFDAAREVISHGAPVAAVVKELRKRAAAAGLSAQEVEAIVQRLGGTGSSSAQPRANTPPAGLELNVPGASSPRSPFPSYGRGGSNATNPFLPGP